MLTDLVALDYLTKYMSIAVAAIYVAMHCAVLSISRTDTEYASIIKYGYIAS